MSGTVLNHFERLRTLLVEARRAIDQAEARVGQFNELVCELSQQGEVPRGFFLGKTIASPWDAEAGRCNGGHVIQAVLTCHDSKWIIKALENLTLTNPRTGEPILRK